MSKEAQGYPHRQDFNVDPKPGKKRGWWMQGFRKAEQPKKKGDK